MDMFAVAANGHSGPTDTFAHFAHWALWRETHFQAAIYRNL